MAGSSRQEIGSNGSKVILLILAAIAMMVMFIEIMLVPALPLMAQNEFFKDAHWISWVLSIYLLVGAVSTPITGRLGDMYGKKKVLIAVMVVYIIGLLGCGFTLDISQAILNEKSIFVLLFFRGIQGIGMGMFPLAFGIIRDTFPPQRVPVAIGTVSAMFSVGISIGLLGGGYIISVAHWWDSFHIVAPLFAVLTVASYYLIRDPKVEKRGSLDIPGAAFLGLGIFSLLLALTQGGTWGWTDIKIVSLFIFSAMMLMIFAFWETRAKDPVVRLKLLANRGVLGANVTALFVGLSMFLLFQTLPFFLMTPQPLGPFGVTDAFTLGLYMFPSAIPQLIFGPLAGKLSHKIGAWKVLVIGLAVLTIGFMVLIELHETLPEIILSLLITGSGLAFCMVSMINLVIQTSPKSEFGVASGMNTLFRVVGGAIGPVLASVIMAQYLAPFTPIPGLTVNLFSETGYVWAWIAGGLFALLGLIFALILRPRESDYELTEEHVVEERPKGVPQD